MENNSNSKLVKIENGNKFHIVESTRQRLENKDNVNAKRTNAVWGVNVLADCGVFRTYELSIRCENCYRETAKSVEVPRVDDAPADVDEFLESAVLGNLHFKCAYCESRIGMLTHVRCITREDAY